MLSYMKKTAYLLPSWQFSQVRWIQKVIAEWLSKDKSL